MQLHNSCLKVVVSVKVLCKAAPPCNQLQKEEVWTHQPVAAKEEDQIGDCLDLGVSYLVQLLKACNLSSFQSTPLKIKFAYCNHVLIGSIDPGRACRYMLY